MIHIYVYKISNIYYHHLRIYDFYRILLDSMKIKQTLLLFALIVGIGGTLLSPVVYAASCGGVDTSVIGCNDQDGSGVCPDGSTVSKKDMDKVIPVKCPDGSTPVVKIENTGVWGLLKTGIQLLTAAIGLAAVGGIIYASILYTTSGSDVGQTKQAKTIIFNIVLGLVAYAFMWSFLNFIIPGGITLWG